MQKHVTVASAPDRNSPCIGSNIRKLSRLVTRFYDSKLAVVELSLCQFQILECIADSSGQIFSKDIIWNLDIEQSSLSRSLAILQRDGLIEIAPFKSRRGSLLSITATGKERLQTATPAWRSANAVVIAIFDGTLGDLNEAISAARAL